MNLPRLLALAILLPAAAFGNPKLPWEHWARYCYPPELNIEWFIAEDHGPAGGPTAPENFTIHTLVQPRVTQGRPPLGDHLRPRRQKETPAQFLFRQCQPNRQASH